MTANPGIEGSLCVGRPERDDQLSKSAAGALPTERFRHGSRPRVGPSVTKEGQNKELSTTYRRDTATTTHSGCLEP